MLAQIENEKIKCFDCYPVKDYLKEFGFRWNSEEKAWESPYFSFLEEELKALGFKIIKKASKHLPEGFIEKLQNEYPNAFKHQIYASALALSEKSFLIGDEPGVGKTFTALIYADYLLKTNQVNTVFIFSPASIKRQWQQETNKWLNKTAYVIEGDKRKRGKLFEFLKQQEKKLIILNYELLLTEDTYKFLNSFKEFAIVLDEASRIKNHKSKTYKALKKLADRTDYKLALTGTPIENSLSEFWAIAHLLKGNSFMSWSEFENNHVYYTEIKPRNLPFPIRKISGYRNLKTFLYQISPFYIRRKKSDIKEMPQLTEYTRLVDATKLQLQLESKIIDAVKEMAKTEMAALTELSLLRVIADDPRMLLSSPSPFAKIVVSGIEKKIMSFKPPKLAELKEIIDEHPNKKIIILTQFKKMAQLISAEFNNLNPITITGDDNNDKKATKIGAFKNKDFRLLIGTDAIAYGVSIDEADVLINFDIPWSVGKIIQRRDRIYRISSTRPKWVYYLVSQGTEEKVWEILQQKRELFNQVAEGEAMGDLKGEILKNIL